MLTRRGPASYAGILSAKSVGISEEDLLTGKLCELSTLRVSEAPADLPVLLQYIDDPCPAIREIASGIVTSIFDKQTSRRSLIAAFRSLPFTVEGLSEISKKNSGGFLCQLLAMASFNDDGYIRHKAVSVLAAANHPLAIRFLVYRLSDHVGLIREAAAAAIQNYQEPRFYEHFLLQLPAIENIPKAKKAHMGHVNLRLCNFLAETELTPAIMQFIRRRDKIRKSLFLLFINRWGATPQITQLFLQDRDSQIRKSLLFNMTFFNDESQKDIYTKLLFDTCADVRFHALSHLAKTMRADSVAEFLCDSDRRVRKLACRLMNFSRQQQLAYYRALADEEVLTPGIIAGLCDHGAFDVELFKSSIRCPDNGVVEAALAAIMRIDWHMAANAAIDRLATATGGLRRCCMNVLSRHYNPGLYNKLMDLYGCGDVELRKTIVSVFGHMKNWYAFPALLQAVSDPDDGPSLYARYYIRVWIRHPSGEKTLPPGVVMSRIAQLMPDVESRGDVYRGDDDVWMFFFEFWMELRDFYEGLRRRARYP